MTLTNICMKALKHVTTDLTEKQIRSLLTSVITMGATEVDQLRIPYEGSYTEGRLSGNGAWVMQVDYEANKKHYSTLFLVLEKTRELMIPMELVTTDL